MSLLALNLEEQTDIDTDERKSLGEIKIADLFGEEKLVSFVC